LNKYDREHSRFSYFRNDPNDPKSLKRNFIFPIHVDSKGMAWIGASGEGVNRFKLADRREQTLTSMTQIKLGSLSSNWANSIWKTATAIYGLAHPRAGSTQPDNTTIQSLSL
jgi:hypothetical protein